MTYLFKLARRLSTAYLVPTIAVLSLACAEAEPREFLSPDPDGPPPSSTSPVALVVNAGSQTLPYDQSIALRAFGRLANGDSVDVAVSWSATAGQIDADGRYRGTVPGTHSVTAYAIGKPSLKGSAAITVSNPGPLFSTLTVHPKPILIYGGSLVQFGVTARLQSGANTMPAVTWHATGGVITPSGAYEAGLTPGQYLVIATTLYQTLSDTAHIFIQPPTLEMLQLSPRVVTLPGGAAQEFEVETSWTDGSTDVPELEWESPAGQVIPLSAAGGPQAGAGEGFRARFEAGTQPGTYKLVVKHRESGKSDTASVTITPTLARVELTPESVDLVPGVSAAFLARGRMTDGAQTSVSVSWSATGGTVSSTGLYTAGTNPGTYRVIARLTSGQLADTSVVRIAQPAATLTRVTVTPDAGTVAPGGAVDFQAQALWSDGSTALPGLTWTAQAGTVTSQGRWTAPAAPGTYRIVVRHAGGTLSDTAFYNVVVPPASLSALSVSPEAPAVQGGAQVDFQAQATWTDGSTTVPALVWTATGGAVTPGGRWTAPNVAGVYRVVARENQSGLADTAVVSVSAVPTITSIRVTPRLAALSPGGSLQVWTQVTWSDGQSRPSNLVWTATMGEVSMNGFFTAGNLAGQAMVIASCAGCTVADTSRITITDPVVAAPVVTALVLSPSQISLSAGEAREFNVQATWSDGSTTVPPLSWTAGGGTMQGLHYIAGATGGDYLVIVRPTGSLVADTARVTIAGAPAGPATLTQLVLNPGSFSLPTGATQALQVSAAWSDGSTAVPPITWSATGGTVSGTTYTAGGTAGTFRIIATHQGGTKADTTAVTVTATAAAPVLQSLTVSPASASVSAGGTLSFTVTGQMSDGSTTTPTVAWTATGGTISSGGSYTAGATTGTFQVTATHAGTGLTAQRAVTITAPQAWNAIEPELPRVTVDVSYPTLSGNKVNVAAGGNLQAAINGATCGDEILLAPGATYVGNFTLPAKSCSGWIVIRTNTVLPPAQTRVTPATAVTYAKIHTATTGPALEVSLNAKQYRVVGVEISAQASLTSVGALVSLPGHDATTLSQIPRDIIFDRVYIHGHATLGMQRCVQLDGIHAAVIDSYLSRCHGKGFDSQAILMYASPGPAAILNNYLEGAGENIMLGGANPSVANVIPSDITIRGNHFFKPTSWKGVWSVKNLFEIKNGQRVLLEGNVFENNWVDAQTGQAILIKSTNSGGAAPWTTASDVTLRYNLIRNSPSALNLAADPSSNPVVPAARIKFEHNVFEAIGSFNGTSHAYWGIVQGSKSGLKDVQFVHNTAATGITNSLMAFDGSPESARFILRDNHFALGAYGLKGSGTGSGTSALTHYFQSYRVAGNAFIGSSSLSATYPSGNQFISAAQGVQSLVGTDGQAPGADVVEVARLAVLARTGVR